MFTITISDKDMGAAVDITYDLDGPRVEGHRVLAYSALHRTAFADVGLPEAGFGYWKLSHEQVGELLRRAPGLRLHVETLEAKAVESALPAGTEPTLRARVIRAIIAERGTLFTAGDEGPVDAEFPGNMPALRAMQELDGVARSEGLPLGPTGKPRVRFYVD